MKKIVIGKGIYGLNLSEEAKNWLRERDFGSEYKEIVKSKPGFYKVEPNKREEYLDHAVYWDLRYEQILRDDPLLIECVETLGKKANGEYSELVIEEYDDENYYVDYIERAGEYSDSETLILKPIRNENKIKVKDLLKLFYDEEACVSIYDYNATSYVYKGSSHAVPNQCLEKEILNIEPKKYVLEIAIDTMTF